MEENSKEWKGLIAENISSNNWKKLIFGEIKKITRWG